jgi:hypothetical protein
MLRIPIGHSLLFTEYICRECDSEFYTSIDPGDTRICPFCGKVAWANGDIKMHSTKDETLQAKKKAV